MSHSPSCIFRLVQRGWAKACSWNRQWPGACQCLWHFSFQESDRPAACPGRPPSFPPLIHTRSVGYYTKPMPGQMVGRLGYAVADVKAGLYWSGNLPSEKGASQRWRSSQPPVASLSCSSMNASPCAVLPACVGHRLARSDGLL